MNAEIDPIASVLKRPIMIYFARDVGSSTRVSPLKSVRGID